MGTFSELCDFVVSDLQADGDTQFSFPSGVYYTSAFGKRVASLLKLFSVKTYNLFTLEESITIGSGDQTFSLVDPDNCAKSFYRVEKVWLNNEEIRRLDSVKEMLANTHPTDTSGLPHLWVQLNESSILFNRSPSGSIANSYVAGYYRHPNITADSTVVQFPDEEWSYLSRVIGLAMRENVFSDDIGLQRVMRLDQQVQAYFAEKKQRAIINTVGFY
jgi:hypothetical protein